MASKKMLHACLRVENLEASQNFMKQHLDLRKPVARTIQSTSLPWFT
ncbi:lactoylglutathione lyase and related lyases [Streptococcus suis]|nr:lactoylglutathione lyase and related lyases [Streptococcus suis]